MKIAVVTDDHQTVSAHFGRAAYYEIFTVENGKITGRQTASKSNHQHASLSEFHEAGHQHNHDHNSMLEPILDCQVLITRGMGMGAYNALQNRKIEPVITDIQEIEKAVAAYLSGTLVSHPERLH
jgi:predicted Fe-Mo cluster-binding NifX family protein